MLLPVQPLHDVQKRVAGVGVEVGRGLVRKHECGQAHHSPGDRYALLLATGELSGLSVLQALEADLLEELPHAPVTLLDGHSPQQERELRVLQSRQHGEQVEGLKDEADALEPELGQLLVGELGDLLLAHPDPPAGGAGKPPEHVEKGRLPGPGGASHGHEVSFVDLKGDATDRFHILGLLGIDLPEILGAYCHLGGKGWVLVRHSNFRASATSILVAWMAG